MSFFTVLTKLILATVGAAIGLIVVLIWASESGLSTNTWTIIGLIVCPLSALGAVTAFFPPKTSAGFTGVVPLETLCESLLVFRNMSNASFEVAIVRQSGYVQRVVECKDAETAKKLVIATFNRKQVSKVRIWKNSDIQADVRINYHHHIGRAEGKIIAGVSVRPV